MTASLTLFDPPLFPAQLSCSTFLLNLDLFEPLSGPALAHASLQQPAHANPAPPFEASAPQFFPRPSICLILLALSPTISSLPDLSIRARRKPSQRAAPPALPG